MYLYYTIIFRPDHPAFHPAMDKIKRSTRKKKLFALEDETVNMEQSESCEVSFV